MDDREVYVVRVYRNDVQGVAGVVERVQDGEQRSFRTASGLLRALESLLSLDVASHGNPLDQENDS